jgi:gamma-glutamylcyclotransferase (GGCT)/AIG2-like uncharacterized protein YtfP
MASNAEHRLATYGTLGPGGPNHHQLSELRGEWSHGSVRGTLHQEGWGAAQGYPGLVLAPDAGSVAVDLLFSEDLPEHWRRLDAYEGDGYRRVKAEVSTGDGAVEAYIYVLAKPA